MGTTSSTMSLLIFPEWTATNIGITTLQVLSACTAGIGEANGDNAGYSKFVDTTAKLNVPSRVGMFVIYVLGLLVSVWALNGGDNSSARATMVRWMLFGHYAKRELEVLFLHKYSSKIHLPSSCMISVAYGLAAFGIDYFTAFSSASLTNEDLLAMGLYLVGQLGNGYHHWLLASLRVDESKGYVLPTTGLFPWVACPHYFFELVSWTGLARQPVSIWLFELGFYGSLPRRPLLCDSQMVQDKVRVEIPRGKAQLGSIRLLIQGAQASCMKINF